MAARHASPLEALWVDKSFDGAISVDEPLSRHTTYRIGGPARYYVRADSIGSLTKVVEACDQTQTPWLVVGRGSNLLVSDEGFPGVIITLGRDFHICRFDAERSCFCVGAGVNLSTVVQEAFTRSLAGLEFAVGTPGTVGGALRMNAGTREIGLGNQVISVTVFERGVGLRRIPREQLAWGYRQSSFTPDQVILECELLVGEDDPMFVRSKMEGSLTRRRKTQPLNLPSCGSVFRNPEGDSAGRLIESLGLMGCTVGGAQVSTQHANFIVNTGNATARDVCTLILMIQTEVKQHYGIELQPEVRFVGFA